MPVGEGARSLVVLNPLQSLPIPGGSLVFSVPQISGLPFVTAGTLAKSGHSFTTPSPSPSKSREEPNLTRDAPN